LCNHLLHGVDTNQKVLTQKLFHHQFFLGKIKPLVKLLLNLVLHGVDMSQKVPTQKPFLLQYFHGRH